ncbi:hypothetical protein MEO40_26280 [Dolichospermum sp. ST_sed1]|nr:hypothetical protein [Dolichospermum sp. ST_sed1]
MQKFNSIFDIFNQSVITATDLLILDFESKQQIEHIFLQIENLNYKGKICSLYPSNELNPEKFFNLRSDHIIVPKPITKNQFISLLSSLEQSITTQPPTLNFSKIVVIDDNAMILHAWKKINKDILCFNTPEEFLEYFNTHEDLLSSIEFIVTDYYFEDLNSSFDGHSFAKYLKHLNFTNPIYLASGVEGLAKDQVSCFAKIISKNPKIALKQILSEDRQ